MKVGFLLLAAERAAPLLAGTLLKLQRYVSGSLSASVEPLPSNVTRDPTLTDVLWPALATGGVFVVVMVTVEGALAR